MLRCCWKPERELTWTHYNASWLPYEPRGAGCTYVCFLIPNKLCAGEKAGRSILVVCHRNFLTFLFRHELVQLLLSYGAEVNCYFRVISNTLFPTALQYSLRDQIMLRLLLNNGYQAYKYVYLL